MEEYEDKISSKVDATSTACPNCGTAIAAEYEFCPNCGQARIQESMDSFLSEFLKDYFTFDSEIFRSLKPLPFNPGFLVSEYLAGRRIRYIPPLRISIFSSILFFILFGFRIDNSQEAVGDELDQFFSDVLPKLFFLLLPLFALLIQWIFGKKGSGYLPHFLFSTYFHAFGFVVGSIYWLMSKLFQSISLTMVNTWLLALTLAWLFLYLWFGLKKVYAHSVVTTSLRLMGLSMAYILLLVLSAIIAMTVLLGIS
jgi:predicted RNA-binding Zn-ribbon protein involved in translation (DUF1610 family)